MVRYRSYHGATSGSMTLTGDPRRWASEPGIPGVVRVLDPYHGIERGWDDAATSLKMIEEVIQLEGAHTIAAFILESVTGTNGILIPPDGYMQGVRELCTSTEFMDDCRRGDGRVRPHRQVVRDRSLERRARPDDDGQGVDERIRSAGCCRHASSHCRSLPRRSRSMAA